MRTFGRYLGRFLALLVLAGVGLWIFGPYERISLIPTFESSAVGADVDGYLADREAALADITPGTEKRVIWAGDAGVKTPLAIIYVHGFSATSEEIRPVPDMLAEDLGANLHFTRLTGHGRSGEALAGARVQDWMNDVAEALEIGQRIGDEVIVVATSTGATLIAEAALQPNMLAGVKGVAMISPNFRINDPAAFVLTLPAARHWVPLAVGETRSWQGQNADHDKYWTTSYPTVGLFQMAALVKHSFEQDYAAATLPVMFMFSDADDVVDHAASRQVAKAWGGPVTLVEVVLPEGNDPNNHVIAGEVLSPRNTLAAKEDILIWINGLN